MSSSAKGKVGSKSVKKNLNDKVAGTSSASSIQSSAASVVSNGNSVSTTQTSNASTVPAEKKSQAPPAPSQPVNSPLKHTALEDIPVGVQRLADSFHKLQKTHSLQFRLNQLRNIYFALKDNVDAITEALEKDFGRSPSETRNLEVYSSLNELVFTMANLHKWAKPDKVTDLPVNMKTNPVYVEKIPLGVVLIITPFNYPLFLAIPSIVGAIAAGNCVVLKPSEATPHFSQLLSDLLTKALDPDIFFAVNGAIPETTKLLDQRFDKIMYTGNNTVGTIIAKKAAETLTPVILELGGKSPAFVLEDVKDKDIPAIASRLAWGRFTNAGQTCVAVDYLLVHKSVKAKLVAELIKVTNEKFYPGLDKDNKDYTHIIHDRAFQNLSKIIETTKGDIVVGGESDAASRYLPPTIVDNVKWDDSTMRGEIFGPILPIIEYDDLLEAISRIVSGPDTPLAQYIFTSGKTSRNSNPQLNQILTSIRSGATIVNDVLLHVALANAPFGGVGNSGHGAYHGIYSFRAFSHERTTIEQKLWNEFMLKVRYPPFTDEKNKVLQVAQTEHNGKVWFNRTGNVRLTGPGTFFNIWTGVAGVVAIAYAFSGAL
jgi:aldehyde dehydrogenase (NAD+)/aldehyde dehydrogenase (NAD(P)+)